MKNIPTQQSPDRKGRVIKKSHRVHQLITIAIICLFFLTGCASLVSRPTQICPGKSNTAKAITELQARIDNITAIKAYGLCKLNFYDEKGKKLKEAFPIRLWAEPPSRISLHANMLFNPSAIVVGSNEEEFWVCSPPMKSYAWGQFNNDGSITLKEEISPELSGFSPQFLLDATGLTKIDNPSNWSLHNADAFDVLEKHTPAGKITKRIYINCCDYTVRTIEYLSSIGNVTASIELDDYKIIAEGINVPHKIQVVQINDAGLPTSADIKLDKIQLAELSDQQQQAFFSRPKPDSFEKILKITE